MTMMELLIFLMLPQRVGISNLPMETYGISFADSDHDGDLDLYVCLYAFNVGPIPNKLYENQGNGSFIDVAAAAGVEDGLRTSFMGIWFDYNNDDLIDLHVINDRDQFADGLYQNGGSNSFTNVAVATGVANDGHNPMTTSVSDFNNDGFQDIFVSDVADGSLVNGVPIDYKLFKNQAGVNFIDVAPLLGIDTNLIAWGALWVDYDNDGFEDLYIATSALNGLPSGIKSSLLYHNNAGLSFTLMNSSINGIIDNSSYCPVKGDINNDGFYDITVLTDAVPPNVFLNDGGNTNGYIKITPVGTVSNRSAIGSKVRVFTSGIAQLQTVFCGSGLCAQNSQHMIFGIRNALIVDSIEVHFPSGIIVKKYGLAANQSYEIIEQTIAQVTFPSGSNVILCPGDSVTIGITGYTNYEWDNGSSDSLITVSSAGTYSFTATNALGNTLFQSNVMQVSIETPSIYQVVAVHPLCGIGNFGSIELQFSLPQDSLNTVDWSNGDDGFLLDSVTGGTYNYTITSVNNCLINESEILIETLPFDVQFITMPDDGSNNGSVQLFVFGGLAPFTFTLDGNFESDLIENLSAGAYQVEVTDVNGCIVTVDFIINNNSSTSLNEEVQKKFKIFYKKESLSICGSDLNDIQHIELRDMTGKIVPLQSEWKWVSESCIINTVNLAEGIYQVYLKTKTSETSQTIFAH